MSLIRAWPDALTCSVFTHVSKIGSTLPVDSVCISTRVWHHCQPTLSHCFKNQSVACSWCAASSERKRYGSRKESYRDQVEADKLGEIASPGSQKMFIGWHGSLKSSDDHCRRTLGLFLDVVYRPFRREVSAPMWQLSYLNMPHRDTELHSPRFSHRRLPSMPGLQLCERTRRTVWDHGTREGDAAEGELGVSGASEYPPTVAPKQHVCSHT